MLFQEASCFGYYSQFYKNKAQKTTITIFVSFAILLSSLFTTQKSQIRIKTLMRSSMLIFIIILSDILNSLIFRSFFFRFSNPCQVKILGNYDLGVDLCDQIFLKYQPKRMNKMIVFALFEGCECVSCFNHACCVLVLFNHTFESSNRQSSKSFQSLQNESLIINASFISNFLRRYVS